LVDHKYIELTKEIVDEYRNTGGFDIIGWTYQIGRGVAV